MENILKNYELKKDEIRSRLDSFKELSEEDKFKEFLFCLLTPQSNAKKCWSAVEEISKIRDVSLEEVTEILRTRTRFHNTKAKRILWAFDNWNLIKNELRNCEILDLRNKLAKIVNGYGLKEAGHFLRNVGLSDNKIAILDRHILRNLVRFGIIEDEMIKSGKHYLEVEKLFLNFAEDVGIPVDELDMFWWAQENGNVFK